jgi:hypothetical protein
MRILTIRNRSLHAARAAPPRYMVQGFGLTYIDEVGMKPAINVPGTHLK